VVGEIFGTPAVAHSIYTVGLISTLWTRTLSTTIQPTLQTTTYNGITVSVAESTITRVPVAVAVCIASTTRDRFTTDQPFFFEPIRAVFKTDHSSNPDIL
jgi:hypothetical protein